MGNSVINATFANYGTFQIDTGAWRLGEGGNQSRTGATTVITSGATLYVATGFDYTVAGGYINTSGTAVFRGVLVNDAGSLVLGTQTMASTFEIWGDYTQGANASLAISVLGASHSQLNVSKWPNNNIGTGSVTLDGQVVFLISQSTPPGATPAGGRPFLTYLARAGTFASWTSTLPNGWNDMMMVHHQVTGIGLNANGTEYDYFIS